MIDRSVIEVLGGDDFLHNLLLDLFSEHLSRDIFAVLGTDNYCVYSFRNNSSTIIFVLDCHLGFRVGP